MNEVVRKYLEIKLPEGYIVQIENLRKFERVTTLTTMGEADRLVIYKADDFENPIQEFGLKTN